MEPTFVKPTLTPSKSKLLHKPKLPENANPNLTTPNPNTNKSSKTKDNRSAVKKHVPVASPSPKNKIRERKFVVAKKNNKPETVKKCVSVAYESLKASQDNFIKSGNLIENDKKGVIGEKYEKDEKGGKFEESENAGVNVSEKVKRRREKMLEVARESVPESGCGRVMHLVKAFETALTLPKGTSLEEGEGVEGGGEGSKKVVNWELPGLRPRAPVTEFSSPELVVTRESLGLDYSSDGSCSQRRNSGGGRHSRRNSSESSATCGTRGKRRTHKATPQQPFKLQTEQRGRSKQEEFTKKVQEMMIEQEKQRIRVAQGLPWTTDEPECLARPPVKESTRPVDLVLHSDTRAMERAEFDHQVQEKLSSFEQYKQERERQQKLEEEEELRRLRKELVPKAQPMPYFDKPFVPKRSEKQPTLPKEPRFHNPQQKKMHGGH